MRRLVEGGPVLGLIEDVVFETGQVTLQPGDSVTMVTDGVTEALSPEGEEFGDARVETALRDTASRSATLALDALVGSATAWAGVAGCSDDLTVLMLKALQTP